MQVVVAPSSFVIQQRYAKERNISGSNLKRRNSTSFSNFSTIRMRREVAIGLLYCSLLCCSTVAAFEKETTGRETINPLRSYNVLYPGIQIHLNMHSTLITGPFTISYVVTSNGIISTYLLNKAQWEAWNKKGYLYISLF
jgi:hypothetical protein